jgi:hypothetical protein
LTRIETQTGTGTKTWTQTHRNTDRDRGIFDMESWKLIQKGSYKFV